MILAQYQQPSYTLLFVLIGGAWTLVTFLVGFWQNRFKERVESIKTIREYNKELREWANQVVDLMSQAGHLCDIDPQRDDNYFEKRHQLLIQLSSYIDRGRFFLPNDGADQFGHHKPSAYKGFRSAALDHLVTCYRLTQKVNLLEQAPNKELREPLMEAKRRFVSSVQDKLDPRKLENDMIKIFN